MPTLVPGMFDDMPSVDDTEGDGTVTLATEGRERPMTLFSKSCAVFAGAIVLFFVPVAIPARAIGVGWTFLLSVGRKIG